jgi:hypothetical protein
MMSDEDLIILQAREEETYHQMSGLLKKAQELKVLWQYQCRLISMEKRERQMKGEFWPKPLDDDKSTADLREEREDRLGDKLLEKQRSGE